jgi:hypothetical protein
MSFISVIAGILVHFPEARKINPEFAVGFIDRGSNRRKLLPGNCIERML